MVILNNNIKLQFVYPKAEIKQKCLFRFLTTLNKSGMDFHNDIKWNLHAVSHLFIIFCVLLLVVAVAIQMDFYEFIKTLSYVNA
jgi:hypothetical protein